MRLLRANAENRLDKELTQIGKAGLIILDELGYVPIDEEGSRLLFQVVTNAYERQSVIYTTNIESGGWGRIFGDPNTARRLSIDRTVHHGRMIRFEGDSCNNKQTQPNRTGPDAQTATNQPITRSTFPRSNRGGDGMLDSLSGRSRHRGEVFEGTAQARGGVVRAVRA